MRLVRHALEAPLRQIVENAGYSGSVLVAKIAQQPSVIGFGAVSERLVDMFAAGILDPMKVTRSAFLHAASIAGLLRTTDVLMTDSLAEKPGERVPSSCLS